MQQPVHLQSLLRPKPDGKWPGNRRRRARQPGWPRSKRGSGGEKSEASWKTGTVKKGVTYCDVLSKAKEAVNIGELGIVGG